MKINRYILLLLLLCLLPFLSEAKLPVKFLYDADFMFYFDNIESDRSPYADSQTLTGVRLAPEIGVGIADSTYGDHRLMAGVVYLQPFGAGWDAGKLQLTAYYSFAKSGFSMQLGFLPYRNLIESLPDYLQSDSLNYYNANIQGALFQYQSRKGFASIFLDWRIMPAADKREAFRVVGTGQYRKEWFNVGAWAQLNHLACSKPYIDGEGVCDDLLLNPYVGFDLGKVTPLDSFSIRAGYMLGIQRDRAAGLDYICNGGILEIFLRWRFIGFKNSTYYGNPQFPLYDTYGSLLNRGDSYYQASFYNRSDIFFYIYNNRFVNCYVSANFMISDGNFSCSQQITAQFLLSRIWQKDAAKLRTQFGK